MTVGLSMKAAVYDGILSSTVKDTPVSCQTANCTWPAIPTLGVCGNCSQSLYRTSCDLSNHCSYTMPSGTTISSTGDATSEYQFTVSPSNGTKGVFESEFQAFFSIFDIMTVEQTPSRTLIEAHECSLWFCIHSYDVTVVNGTQASTARLWRLQCTRSGRREVRGEERRHRTMRWG